MSAEFYTCFTANHTSKCFDVSMYKPASDFKWSFGHCSSAHNVMMGLGTYIQKCCLSEGIHLLTCKTARHETDWSNNVVMILGHRFCEDFVGYEEVTPIHISGLCECSQIIIVKVSKDKRFMRVLLLPITNSLILFYSTFAV